MLHYGVPREYGGGGLGSLEGCLIAEELGAARAGVEVGLRGNILGLIPLLIAGSAELKEELLPQHCSGPNLAALCLTEAGAGSDAGSMRTRARRLGHEYIIESTKPFITNGGVASLHSVFAKAQPELGCGSISAFMVPADAGGVSLGKREDKMGQRSADTRDVIFEQVRIPSRFRLGGGRDGFKIAMETLDASRPVVGSQVVGIARAAFETAVTYVKQQSLSDRPVVASQGREFMLADMGSKMKRRDCCAGTRLGLAITVTGTRNNRQSRSASRPISPWK